MIQNNSLGILELLTQPAFCVKAGTIVQVNHSATQYMIQTGTPVASLLGDAAEEYVEFTEGCLLLTLTVSYVTFSASVTAFHDFHVFVLEPVGDEPALRAMALAARELRTPLGDLMATSQQLFPELEKSVDEASCRKIQTMNRSMYQLMRVICNMSDADRYTKQTQSHYANQNICSILEELFDKSAAMVEHCQIKLEYHGPIEAILMPVYEEILERAVLNMISNALKFTESGSTIRAQLTRRGKRLHLSVENEGTGPSNNSPQYMRRLYQRQPALEDPRYGLGLGMEMIRTCATIHGGTVLITHPTDNRTKITMTLTLPQSKASSLRSNIRLPDYAGERNHFLLELAEHLPAELYASDSH